jgi:hypothetical protein
MSMAETFARNIAAIRAAGGIAQVNHPNYLWSVRPEDLRGLPDDTLLEIWNGQPACHNLGGRDDAGREAPSAEALWDQILSTGKHVWGVASDDSHDYRNVGPQQASSPGQGWVVVRAEKLDPSAIVEALGRGSFYASTGIELGDYRVAGTEISLVIKAPPRSETRYVTCFIGSGGKLLKEVHGLRPRYRIRGHEGYVRARVTDSDGHQAWTQPVFVKDAVPVAGERP